MTLVRARAPLQAIESPIPVPEPKELLVKVGACGVCRTDLVPRALAELDKGGTIVCAGIHMTDIPAFPYELLWGERSIRSVANLTRRGAAVLLP